MENHETIGHDHSKLYCGCFVASLQQQLAERDREIALLKRELEGERICCSHNTAYANEAIPQLETEIEHLRERLAAAEDLLFNPSPDNITRIA